MNKEPKVTCLDAWLFILLLLLSALRQRVLLNTSGQLKPFPSRKLTPGSVLLTAAGHLLLQHHFSLRHCLLLLRLVFASAKVPSLGVCGYRGCAALASWRSPCWHLWGEALEVYAH